MNDVFLYTYRIPKTYKERKIIFVKQSMMLQHKNSTGILYKDSDYNVNKKNQNKNN